MFSKDLYNIHFKGVVIVDMSFERNSFPQSQAFIQVVNVITALLLRSYFYACVKQLFSVIIFHISSWKIFPMICRYTNESSRIKEAKFSCSLQSEEFQFKFPIPSHDSYSYLWSFPYLVFRLCKKDFRSHLKVRIKEPNKSNPEILVTSREWKIFLSQLSLIKIIFIRKTSLWMRPSLS